jgi:hypothetical protein
MYCKYVLYRIKLMTENKNISSQILKKTYKVRSKNVFMKLYENKIYQKKPHLYAHVIYEASLL